MSSQVLKATAAVLDTKMIPNGDVGVVVDSFGVPTGGIRLGAGDIMGGLIVSGAVGAGGVTSVNGLVGAVSLVLNSLSGVTITSPVNGQSLVYNGTTWVNGPQASTINASGDALISTLANGHILIWDAAIAKWTNRPFPAVGGAADNLGNHIASQPLNMAGFGVAQASSMTFLNGWTVSDNNVNALVFSKSLSGVLTPIWTIVHTGVEGAGQVAFKDYSSLRPDDSASTAVTNLAYFHPAGAMRKADLSLNPAALKGISADKFGGLAFSGATNGQVLTYNSGTGNFVPATPSGGGGVSTFLALTDTPSSFAANALKHVAVNAAGTALEFVTQVGTFAALAEAVAALPHAEDDTILFKSGAWGIYPSTSNTVAGASDVTGTPTDGQGLVWDTLTSQFVFADCLRTGFGTLAAGHIMYYTGTEWVNLAPGANGTVLTMVAGLPAWA